MRTQTMLTREIVEIGVAVALSAVLSLIRLYRLPQGGSITLETIPVLYVALHRGARIGMLTGLVLGGVKLLLGATIVHPIQLILDYPLAFALLGCAGFVCTLPAVGVLVGQVARGLSHFLSGVVFFGSFAPEGTNVWAYSAAYNLSYVLPEAILAMIVVPILLRKVR